MIVRELVKILYITISLSFWNIHIYKKTPFPWNSYCLLQ